MKKESNIHIKVEVDKNHIPEKIEWAAKDAGVMKENSEAMFVSFWDEKTKNTLKVDLWTKDMPMDSMKMFVIQNMALLGEYYERATSDTKNARQIKKLVADLKIQMMKNN